MKKSIVWLLLVALLVGLLPVSVASAQSIADLTALAAYFPADTAAFFAVRTDDSFIETLDGLVARVAAHLPAADRPQTTLREALDEAARQIDPQADFETVFRAWLGNTIAVGALSLEARLDDDSFNDGEDPYLVAIDIRNRALAEAFVEEAIVANSPALWEVKSEGGYTVYSAEGIAILVGDDVAFIGNAEGAAMLVNTGEESLADNPDFSATLALLPEDGYSGIAYVDVRADLAAASETMSEGELQMAAPFLSATPIFALGFTLGDGGALVVDVAQHADVDALAGMGLALSVEAVPIDLGFAAHIPADVSLVLHGSNLAGLINAALENASALGQLQGAEAEDVEQQLASVSIMLRGLTGLNLQEDLLAWMTGDYALFLGLSPALAGAESMEDVLASLPVEFGLVFETTDPAAAQHVVATLSEELPTMLNRTSAENVTLTLEEIGGGNVLVLTVAPSRDTPFPVEILLGANDAVLALGTRGAVTAALEASGGLDTTAAYAGAQTYLLPDTQMLLFLNPQGLAPLANLLEANVFGPGGSQDAAELRLLLDLFHSVSVTAVTNLDGTSVARFVLMLAE